MESKIKSVPVFEQETHISYMRDQTFVKVYTSDTTQITRFDKLCKEYPDMWECVEDHGISKNYLCKDKSMISTRGKKRNVSDEARLAASIRLKEMHNQKQSEINSNS